MDKDSETPAERIAAAIGKSAGEVAAYDSFFAGLREYAVARSKMFLAMHEAAGALRNFGDAWQAVEARLVEEEAAEVAAHPDLAEINVYLDGFYA